MWSTPLRRLSPSLLALAAIGPATASAQVTANSCIAPAAGYHQVNQDVLRAILQIEDPSGTAATVTRNSNGTIDAGCGGTNSVHWPRLATWNIQPGALLDLCVCTYVTAMLLSEAMAKHGNTWQGIASYHSTTPYYNQRYQVLLSNQLIRNGVVAGKVVPAPPLRPPAEPAP